MSEKNNSIDKTGMQTRESVDEMKIVLMRVKTIMLREILHVMREREKERKKERE